MNSREIFRTAVPSEIDRPHFENFADEFAEVFAAPLAIHLIESKHIDTPEKKQDWSNVARHSFAMMLAAYGLATAMGYEKSMVRHLAMAAGLANYNLRATTRPQDFTLNELIDLQDARSDMRHLPESWLIAQGPDFLLRHKQRPELVTDEEKLLFYISDMVMEDKIVNFEERWEEVHKRRKYLDHDPKYLKVLHKPYWKYEWELGEEVHDGLIIPKLMERGRDTTICKDLAGLVRGELHAASLRLKLGKPDLFR